MQTPFGVEVEYWNLIPDAQLHITLHLYTEQDIIAFTTGGGLDPEWRKQRMKPGLYRTVCEFPGDLLNSGRHHFAILVVKDRSTVIHRYESSVIFDVLDVRARPNGWYGKEPGVVQPALKWSTEFLGQVSERVQLTGTAQRTL